MVLIGKQSLRILILHFLENYFRSGLLHSWFFLVSIFIIGCQKDQQIDFSGDIGILLQFDGCGDLDTNRFKNDLLKKSVLAKQLLYLDYNYHDAEEIFLGLEEETNRIESIDGEKIKIINYLDLSYLYILKKDFDFAYVYSLLAYKYASQLKDSSLYAHASIAHAIVLFNTKKYDQSFQYLDRAVTSKEHLLPFYQEQILFYRTLNHINAGNQSESDSILIEVKNYALEQEHYFAEYHRLMGIYQYRSGNYSEVINHCLSSIAFYKRRDCSEATALSNVYALVSGAYLKSRQYEKALAYQDTAIQIVHSREKDFSRYFDDPKLITHLSDYLEIRYKIGLIDSDTVELIKVFHLYEKVDSMILRNSRSTTGSYLENKRFNNYFYSNFISLCADLFYLTRNDTWLASLHKYYNKYKASSLTLNQQYVSFLRFVGNDDPNLTQSIINNNRLLNTIYRKIYEKSELPGISELLEFLTALNKYKRFEKTLSYKYRMLFKNASTIPSIDLLHIDKDTNNLYLWYYLGSKHYNPDRIYCLTRYRGMYKLILMERSDFLKRAIDSLYQLNAQYAFNVPPVKQYARLSYQVYQESIKKALDSFPGVSSISITPDAELSYISFAGLVTEVPGMHDTLYSDLPYLVDSKDISYHFTSRGKKSQDCWDSKQLAFFSWTDEKTIEQSNSTYAELPFSYTLGKELESNYDKLNVSLYAGYRNTLNKFDRRSQNAEIIHLDVHGFADSNNRLGSYLVFRKGKNDVDKLYPYEIFYAGLKPALTILSACESGAGQQLRDEGMFSIARAFYISGSCAVISNLWILEDKVSYQILRPLYLEYLPRYKADTDTKALNNAIRDYLRKQITNDEDLFPGLWSTFIIQN